MFTLPASLAAWLASAQLAAAPKVRTRPSDGGAFAIMGHDHAHAGDRQREGRQLMGLQPLAAAQHRQRDGEEDLHLDHQRGQARRDHAVHGDEQKAELAQPDGQAIDGQIGPADFGLRQEEHHRQQHEGEAQGREQQRRQRVQPDADDDEIGAPDEHHRQAPADRSRKDSGIARATSICTVNIRRMAVSAAPVCQVLRFAAFRRSPAGGRCRLDRRSNGEQNNPPDRAQPHGAEPERTGAW